MNQETTRIDGSSSLERRVSKALELREAGDPNWLARACAGDPASEPLVREAVEAATGLPGVLGESFTNDPRLGRHLEDRYLLERRLGSGAMGVVYAARDTDLDRPVAVKVLSSGLLERERAAKRFEREARAMAAVEHDSVIAIHDRGRTEDGEAFLVMEQVDGRQLGTFVEELRDLSPAPPEVDRQAFEQVLGFGLPGSEGHVRTVVRWVADLAAGVQVAHDAGVVHRDIKPSNVIVRRDGRAVLLDFGIAHLADGDSLTRGQTSLGTPAYMAPELLESEVEASPGADVYGLAALLYCLLGLEPPYRGTPTAILHALSTRDPEPIGKRHPNLPRDLVAIVEKGMSRRPRDRYANADALERDLRAFLEHRPVQARPIGPFTRLGRRALRSRTGRGAAAALALVTLLGLGWLAREGWLERREAAWLELSRHFPPNFTILKPELRVPVLENDRRELDRLLDDAANLCVDPLPTYLLRSSVRLDAGDVRGAAADLDHIARHEGTAFSRALARVYASLPGDESGFPAVDLSSLPSPRTARDRYLLAYHQVRTTTPEGYAAARGLLDPLVSEAVPHAEELRFAVRDLNATTTAEFESRLLELHADILRYEERLGVRTASTAHWACFALSAAGSYRDAFEVGLQSVDLAPRSHVNRTNAGAAAYRLGLHEQARELLEVACELRPEDVKPADSIVWSYVAQRNYESAREAVETRRSVFEASGSGAADYLLGEISIFEALDLLGSDGESEEIDRLASAASEHFESAVALGSPAPIPATQVILDGVAERDGQAIFEGLAYLCAYDPTGLWSLALLRRNLPDRLEESSTRMLGHLLSAYEQVLVGDVSAPGG